MRIFVMVDMEGVSGVVKACQVTAGDPEYARARQWLCQDVNACVDGLFAGGASEVTVRDAHGSGFNFLFDLLDPRAEYVQGAGNGPRMPGIGGMDGLALLGYHAMAGTGEAVLEHTMSSKAWQNLWMNGKPAGEIALDAGIAGERGVPTILVSGCDKACREAKQLLPGVFTAAVKTGYGCEYARLLPLPRAQDLIRKKAAEAARACRAMKPFRVKPPVRLRLELIERGRVPEAGSKPWFRKLDNRTYEVRGAGVAEALDRL
jgi:D-amino peptidase